MDNLIDKITPVSKSKAEPRFFGFSGLTRPDLTRKNREKDPPHRGVSYFKLPPADYQ